MGRNIWKNGTLYDRLAHQVDKIVEREDVVAVAEQMVSEDRRAKAGKNLLAALRGERRSRAKDGRRPPTKQTKKAVMSETAGDCESCRVHLPELIHLHHVIPASLGGTDRKSNMAALCPNCHALAHLYYRRLAPKECPRTRNDLFRLLLTT